MVLKQDVVDVTAELIVERVLSMESPIFLSGIALPERELTKTTTEVRIQTELSVMVNSWISVFWASAGDEAAVECSPPQNQCQLDPVPFLTVEPPELLP